MRQDLRERLDEILDEEAPNKWVWKTYFSMDEWLTKSILPLLREIRIEDDNLIGTKLTED
jgi:hypothetical protein